jgi:7-cyano-7-deazaguanine reductase
MTDLHHLGKQTNVPTDTLDAVEWIHGPITITLEVTEFTSLCPVTAQPDFGTLTIAYVPDAQIVETKSLKLWLWRWRDRGAFNETIVATIAADFFEQISPLRVVVTGHFHSRGGISVNPVAERSR